MFNKTELNEKLTAELRELAKANGILNVDALRKAELVEIISQIKAQETESTLTEAPSSVKAPKAKLTKANANANATDKPVRKRTRISKDEADSNNTAAYNRPTLFEEEAHVRTEQSQPEVS